MSTNLGPTGWGNPKHTAQKNLYNEKVLYDVLCDNNPQRISQAYAREESKIEKKVRKYFQFDEGYSFFPVVDIVYLGGFKGEDGGLEPGPQTCGCCVGYSHCLALASKIAHEFYVDGDYEQLAGNGQLGCPFVGYSYGCSRVKVGGVNWRSDGSLSQWIIKASQEYGFLTCSDVGVNSPDPNSSLTRDFGRNVTLLNKYKDKALKNDLLETRVIKSYDDLWQSIVIEKSPCQIASDWGFKYSHKEDQMAIYKASGSWAHQMSIQAAFTVNSNRYAYILNQWGRHKHENPGRQFPKGGFIITEDTFNRWIKNAHCASISKVQTPKLMPEFMI